MTIQAADHLLRALEDAGWTPEVYPWLVALAEHARAVEAHVAQYTVTTGLASVDTVTDRLMFVAEEAAMAGLPLRDMAPWLALVACEPAQTRSEAIQSALKGWGRPEAPQLRPWIEDLGPLGPYVYAARMDREQVLRDLASGAVTEEGVRVLTGLQGYQWPPMDPVS